MSRVVEGLQAVTVHVTDLARARTFYANVLGLDEDPQPPDSPRVVFRIPGSETRLSMHIQGRGEGGRRPGTVSGLLFQCRDPLAACAEVLRKGGKIVNEPWTMHRGARKVVRAVIADPDGNEMILSSEF
jgi:predicted enzyme related to lactoylglutathione lyase